MMRCASCGTASEQAARFCPSCGEVVGRDDQPSTPTAPASDAPPGPAEDPPRRWRRPALVGAVAVLIVAGVAAALSGDDDADVALGDAVEDGEDPADGPVPLPDEEDLQDPGEGADPGGDADPDRGAGAADISCEPAPCERWRISLADASSPIEANTTRAVWLEQDLLVGVEVATGVPLAPVDLGPILADTPIDPQDARPYPLETGVLVATDTHTAVVDDTGTLVRSDELDSPAIVIRPDPSRDTTYLGGFADPPDDATVAFTSFELRDPVTGEAVATVGRPITLTPLTTLDDEGVLTALDAALASRWSRPWPDGLATTSVAFHLGPTTLWVSAARPPTPGDEPTSEVDDPGIELIDLDDGSTTLTVPGVPGLPLALRDDLLVLPVAADDDPSDPADWPVRLVVVEDGEVTHEVELAEDAGRGITLLPGPTTTQVRVDRPDGSRVLVDTATGEQVPTDEHGEQDAADQQPGQGQPGPSVSYLPGVDVLVGPDDPDEGSQQLTRDGRRLTVTAGPEPGPVTPRLPLPSGAVVPGATEPLLVINGLLVAIDMDAAEAVD
ncbi:MAG: hypothetical protein JJT89_14580 [Nitriliruptoraceae bacterium]|nr:hypothetical protein [Nitriliruptoraceae bacterium]